MNKTFTLNSILGHLIVAFNKSMEKPWLAFLICVAMVMLMVWFPILSAIVTIGIGTMLMIKGMQHGNVFHVIGALSRFVQAAQILRAAR